MDKAELVARVAHRCGETREQARLVVDLTFELIRDALSRGEEVRIAGFGSFRRRYLPSHTGRHPRTGEPLTVVGRFLPTFVASNRLRRAVSAAERMEALSIFRPTGQEDNPPVRAAEVQRVQGLGEALSRRVSVHVYLPDCVVIGDVFVSEPSLIQFLQLAGTCLYLHSGVAFPYQETMPPLRAREIAVRKDAILFLVARGALPAAPPTRVLTDVHAWCGPFVVRGKSSLSWAALVREVSELTGQRFVLLWQATVSGPGRANFWEASLLLNLQRTALVGA